MRFCQSPEVSQPIDTDICIIGAGAAVVFKGSGFYQTDYRSESYKKSAEAEKKASSETKTDSKKDGGSSKTKDSASPKSESKKKSSD